MKVTWNLVGGPCEGEYEAESSWPPPRRIRAVHGGGLFGDGPPAVLDLAGDEPEAGERVVEYELELHGHMCGRGRGASALHATYFPAGWTWQQKMKVLRVRASVLRPVA